MNWYRRLKLSQIWDVVDDESSFDDNLKAVYELEYKLQAFQNFKFRGMPRRRENIIERLEDELQDALERVRSPLIAIFDGWLKSHALLDPNLWAEQRVNPNDSDDLSYTEEIGEESALQIVIDEYKRYQNGGDQWFDMYKGANWDAAFAEMMREVGNNIDQYPSLSGFVSATEYDEQNRYTEELSSEGFEQFGEMYKGEPFATEEEAEAYIEEMSENIDLSDYFGNYEIGSFILLSEKTPTLVVGDESDSSERSEDIK